MNIEKLETAITSLLRSYGNYTDEAIRKANTDTDQILRSLNQNDRVNHYLPDGGVLEVYRKMLMDRMGSNDKYDFSITRPTFHTQTNLIDCPVIEKQTTRNKTILLLT